MDVTDSWDIEAIIHVYYYVFIYIVVAHLSTELLSSY